MTVTTLALFLAGAGQASAQGYDDARACWQDYADCARVSQGDENWRSICYADFSGCLGRNELPDCDMQEEVPACVAYLSDCENLAAGDAETLSQCAEDADACALAHGC
jgi:hypothetical protein